MPQMTYSQFNSIRNRAKSELLRRCHVGSVASYGNAIEGSIDDNYILAKDVAPVIAGLLAINSLEDLGLVVKEEPIPKGFDYLKLSNKLSTLESYPLYGGGTGCNASCTGLCTGTCSGTCTSCQGCTSCSGCSGGCSGCSGSCVKKCAQSVCTGSCTGGCTGCGHDCQGGSSGHKDSSASSC